MYELPHELPNDLRLRKLGNFKKIPEMLGFDGEYPAVQPKAKFWHFLVKNCKKSAVKHSIEKPILLNFVNLSPTFCPRLLSGKLGNDDENLQWLWIAKANWRLFPSIFRVFHLKISLDVWIYKYILIFRCMKNYWISFCWIWFWDLCFRSMGLPRRYSNLSE